MKFKNHLFKHIRLERKISTKIIAEYIGRSQPLISYWESGKRTPSKADVIALSKFFDISIEDISDLKESENLKAKESKAKIHYQSNLSYEKTIKELEDKLNKSNKNLQMIEAKSNLHEKVLNIIDDIIYIKDKNLKLLLSNRAFKALANTNTDTYNKNFSSIFKNNEHTFYAIRQLEQEAFKYKKIILNQDVVLPGNKKGLINIIPIYSSGTTIDQIICIIRETTLIDSMVKETHCKEKLINLFLEAINTSTDAFWFKKENTQEFIFCNKQFSQIYTYPLEYFIRDRAFLYKIIHSEDKERVIQNINSYKTTHQCFVQTYRITCINGTIKSLKTKIDWHFDEENDEWYYIGITSDITECIGTPQEYQTIEV
jgi:PAS domain S-box-containing protein